MADDELDPKLVKAAGNFLVESLFSQKCSGCVCPYELWQIYCMVCGKPNLEIDLAEFYVKHDGLSIEDARLKDCPIWHAHDASMSRDLHFCPLCGKNIQNPELTRSA